MANRRKRRAAKQQSREERERSREPEPAIITAAGLLAFYEDEEALVQVKPIYVLLFAIVFSALVAVLHLVFG